jgi:hypothetical protein
MRETQSLDISLENRNQPVCSTLTKLVNQSFEMRNIRNMSNVAFNSLKTHRNIDRYLERVKTNHIRDTYEGAMKTVALWSLEL